MEETLVLLVFKFGFGQGNHEYINGGVIEWTDELRARGVFVLENDCIEVPGLVDFVGVNDLSAGRFDENSKPDPPKVCRKKFSFVCVFFS